jgi:hypothetical protein
LIDTDFDEQWKRSLFDSLDNIMAELKRVIDLHKLAYLEGIRRKTRQELEEDFHS